nr:hydroxymethylbilane synthase [uncultured Mediterraneibacter sp.]
MQSVIRIGSRESLLAVRQAEIIRDQIMNLAPEVSVEIVTMKTTGDKILDKSLSAIGGKGLFVRELDLALLEGRIDIAVHSLKDMPMEVNPELPILAYSQREDPRDVLLYRRELNELPEDAVIGTSSRRRMIQLQRLCPGYTFREIRGNVQTRMRKLESEGLDGTLLAAAGLKRLGMEQAISRYLDVNEMIPAAGQGILAVQGRKDVSWRWIRDVDVPQSRYAALAERQFIRTTEGDCTSPCAAHAQVNGNELKLTGLYCDENMQNYSVDTVLTEASRAQQAGEALAEKMIKRMR